MTFLPLKETRDLIGIDSLERAIIWSGCTLLSAINQKSPTYDRNFSIFADQQSLQILINFALPLDMPLFWSSMGDADLSLKVITDLAITYEGEYLSINKLLEVEPVTVNTLEKYFFWACKKLREFYLKNEPVKANKFNFATDLKRSVMFVNVSLDYNPIVYSESDSLLKAVMSESFTTDSDEDFGNNSLIGNNLLFGN